MSNHLGGGVEGPACSSWGAPHLCQEGEFGGGGVVAGTRLGLRV